ncbi:methyltransferase domain-containing protein [Sandaracinobacter neustonicus]|uniref:Methyltransferase domain-containing protein n=1 Tax=Sandaracinobacter neustonicus TaxID=1715348 RepID=A0A501XLG4_9SPHN|nr:class I SAM-dependent methyltransferase [Sandaracinobacter neustonicus]TPE61410.1 methyltransferase domain-containing protein [Sandaracinobacter neustonicus]
MGWNPADYAEHAGFVPALGAPVLALLAPQPGEAILDLGCGDGVLTAQLAAAGADVLGVDSSAAMLAAARAKGLNVEVADGQALPFHARFDAVFSNAALHWMPDQQAVAEGVFRALKPGGRYVGECGGFMNIAAIRTALRAVLKAHGYSPESGGGQTYLTAEAFAAIHQAAGFAEIDARIIARPTPLPGGIRGWLKTFRAGFLDESGVPEAARAQVIDEIETLLEPVLKDSAGNWSADYVRLRWQAKKPLQE